MKLNKILLSMFITTTTISSANSFVAVIQDDSITKIEINELGALPDPLTIKTLSCTWGECLGTTQSNQSFYIKDGSAPVALSEVTTATDFFVSSKYLFLGNNGDFYARGKNDTGSLGLNIPLNDPVEVENLTQIVGLSGTIKKILPGSVTIAQTSTGLYFSGVNELVSGTPIAPSKSIGQNYNTFNQFLSSTTINDISISGSSFAFVNNGEVFVLGENNKELFGVGVDDHSNFFSTYKKVPDLTGVSKVFIGQSTSTRGSMFVIKNGTIWASGDQTDKLGLNNGNNPVNTFTNTGFPATELNMLSRDDSTYLIKDNKLYYSGKDEFSDTGETSTSFTIVDSTKDMNVKNFITNGEYTIQVLREDGKILRGLGGIRYLPWDPKPDSNLEIRELPKFSS